MPDHHMAIPGGILLKNIEKTKPFTDDKLFSFPSIFQLYRCIYAKLHNVRA